MTRKLYYSSEGIEGNQLFPSAHDVLAIISGGEEHGYINLYTKPVQDSMKIVRLTDNGVGSIDNCQITLLTGTKQDFSLCSDKIDQYQLPETFYIKICKK